MHGRHHTGLVSTTCASPSGRVAFSLVGPNTAVTLAPAAAARCIAPESLVTRPRQIVITPASAGRSVWPTMSSTAGNARLISIAVGASAELPTSTQATPSAASSDASSAKYAGGQRFAPPYAAPGASAINGVVPFHPAISRMRPAASRADQVPVVLRLVHVRWAAHRARQQASAPAAAIPPALRNPGARRNQRGVHRVGQEDRGVELLSCQLRPHRPPSLDAAHGRRRLQHDRLVDARDHRKQRRNRRPRRNGHRRRRRRTTHVGNRRQRHHGVAKPVRREDDQTLHRVLRSERSRLRSVPRMKIALLQVNPTVGDVAGNARRILEALREAAAKGADLAAAPELALVGYLPRDLLLNPGFVARSWEALDS